MPDDLTDRVVLTTREYANPDRLEARYSLYHYRQPRFELTTAAARLLHDAPGPVLDVGCGPGRYLAALRADRPDRLTIGADLSFGMASVAGSPVLVADASSLPVADRSVGVALAMHMLYHVAEPATALAELARVRAPGGTVLLATNASADKERVRTLHHDVVAELTGAVATTTRNISAGFTLEDGEQLAREYFDRVERIDYHGTIAVPDPEPVLAWLGSMSGPDLTPEILAEVRVRVAAAIARDGHYDIGTHVGFLVCH